MAHHITGVLLDAQLHTNGTSHSLHLWIEQSGRYSTRPVRAVRPYAADDAERATRHLGRVRGAIGTTVHVHGQALVALAGGVCLLGAHRVGLCRDAVDTANDAAAAPQPRAQAWPLHLHRDVLSQAEARSAMAPTTGYPTSTGSPTLAHTP
jgi:hypothetical protein